MSQWVLTPTIASLGFQERETNSPSLGSQVVLG